MNQKISNKQLYLLIVVTLLSTTIMVLPHMVYTHAKQDSWLSIIPDMAIGIILAYIITSLGLMFKDKTIIEYSEIIVGKVLGKIIGLILFAFFIHRNTINVRQFSELFVYPFLPETPLLFFTIVIVLVSTYGALKGLEVISRVNEVLFPVFIFSVCGILLLAIQDMELKNLKPILSEGVTPVLESAYHQLAYTGEIIVVSMLIPFVNIPQKTKKTLTFGIITIALVQIIMLISIIAVLGSKTGQLVYPFISLSRYVGISGIIERVEPFLMFMIVGGTFIKIVVFHYCSVLSLSQLLKIKDYRYLALPIGVITIYLSITLWRNTTELFNHIGKTVVLPHFIIEAGIPTILLIIAKLRNKGANK